MATRNIVPRANGEGNLGTTAKKWGEVNAGSVTATGAVSAGSVTATGAVSAAGITTRKNSTAYALDDVAFSASLPGKLMLVCTTPGTTAATAPDFSGATIGGTVTDGTAVWTYMPLGTLSREIVPAFNHRDVITTSGTYTAPVSGWYRITVKGGGSGGQGGKTYSATYTAGHGGGEGGVSIGYEHMTAGDIASVIVGAGGTGGAVGGSNGNDGGDSSVTINNNTYTGGGGLANGNGGSGTIPGAAGSQNVVSSLAINGATGGGNGGALGGTAINGGGGRGGTASTSAFAGGAGGDGFVWFEYWDPTI